MDETFHLNWSFIALREKTTTILGRIKFAHTTTFNISVHHFWADAIWSTFTWSMSAKVVLHRRKIYIINNYSTRVCWIWDDYSQLGATLLVGYNHLISNKREWNNCFIKNAHKISLNLPDLILLEQTGKDKGLPLFTCHMSIKTVNAQTDSPGLHERKVKTL